MESNHLANYKRSTSNTTYRRSQQDVGRAREAAETADELNTSPTARNESSNCVKTALQLFKNNMYYKDDDRANANGMSPSGHLLTCFDQIVIHT